jgi:hypothetical protein
MFSPIFDNTVEAINRWQPTQHYPDENKYRNDLLDYLRKILNETSQFMPQSNISIRKEDGRGLCDIAVGEKAVGIEMKKDLSKKSHVDRLAGQLMDYKKEYDDLIIVLVGKTDKEALEILKLKVSQLRDSGGFSLNQQRIKIIIKDQTAKKDQNGESNIWDVKLPEYKPPKFKF